MFPGAEFNDVVLRWLSTIPIQLPFRWDLNNVIVTLNGYYKKKIGIKMRFEN